MVKDICEPVGKLLDKNKSYDLKAGDETQTELHEYVNGYGEIIYSVVNNAVEFNSHANNQNLKTAEYSIKQLAFDVRHIMLPVAKDSANSISIEIDPSTPDLIVGAVEELKRIIINLLCESLKSTKGGLVTIEISGRKIEADILKYELPSTW